MSVRLSRVLASKCSCALGQPPLRHRPLRGQVRGLHRKARFARWRPGALLGGCEPECGCRRRLLGPPSRRRPHRSLQSCCARPRQGSLRAERLVRRACTAPPSFHVSPVYRCRSSVVPWKLAERPIPFLSTDHREPRLPAVARSRLVRVPGVSRSLRHGRRRRRRAVRSRRRHRQRAVRRRRRHRQRAVRSRWCRRQGRAVSLGFRTFSAAPPSNGLSEVGGAAGKVS